MCVWYMKYIYIYDLVCVNTCISMQAPTKPEVKISCLLSLTALFVEAGLSQNLELTEAAELSSSCLCDRH